MVDEPRSRSNLPIGLLSVGAVFIIVFGLREAQAIVTPLLLSLFFALVLARPVFWLQHKRIPRVIAVFVGVLALVAAFASVGTLLGASINDFTRRAPTYSEQIQEQVGSWASVLARYGLVPANVEFVDYLNPGSAMALVANMFRGFGTVLTNAFLILFTVVFLLLEATSLSRKLHAAFDSPETFGYLTRFYQNLNEYLVLKSLISLVVGATMTAWVSLMGIDYPWLWGLLAFLLNFIPNIGSILASIPPILLCLVDFGAGRALVLGAGYLVVNVTLGNLVEPRLMGQGLGLSTLVVFVSLIFWGWVLGPVGMLLAAPLTMTIKLFLESREETRWMAILLGAPLAAEKNER